MQIKNGIVNGVLRVFGKLRAKKIETEEISYKNDYMIKFKAGAGSGHGIYIGGRGFTLVGSGESSRLFEEGNQDDEQLYLTSDQEIHFLTKCQNGVSSAKDAYMDENGVFNAIAFTPYSDKRLKENLKKYTPSKSILDIPIYRYNYKNSDYKTIGILAQDLLEYEPDLVSGNKEKAFDETVEQKDILKIDESKLIYLLIDEVKKLRDKVSELESKINK